MIFPTVPAQKGSSAQSQIASTTFEKVSHSRWRQRWRNCEGVGDRVSDDPRFCVRWRRRDDDARSRCDSAKGAEAIQRAAADGAALRYCVTAIGTTIRCTQR